MKDENKQTEALGGPVLFDQQLIDRVTFDLVHINHGWDEERRDYAYRCRSSYCAEDIVELFEQFRYFSVEWQLGVNKERVKIKGKSYFRYFWETTDEWGEVLRVVCDLPVPATGEGIIVTVFKL